MKYTFSLILVLSLFFSLSDIQAQSYDSAIGLRLGNPNALSYKKYIGRELALEGIVGRGSYSNVIDVNVGLALQQHFSLDAVMSDLEWYLGIGGTANFSETYNGTAGINTQGYIGLQYNLNIPISITLDWIPSLLFINSQRLLNVGYGNLAIRYVLR